MAKIAAKTYQEELKRLKKLVEVSSEYFKKNYEMFHKFRNFIFSSALSEDDLNVLRSLQKPQIECNTIEPFISRLLGEFSKQQPSINVASLPGYQVDPKVITFLEDYFRCLLFDANKDNFEYEIYKEQLSGGFSGMKYWTEYQSDTSFDQVIRIGKMYDTCLTGFDPLARKPHKGDGRYWFELYPKTKEQFEDEFPGVDIREISYTREIEGFSWSYINNEEKILLICDFYELKEKPMTLYQLANGQSMSKDEYEESAKLWSEAIIAGQMIAQPPVVIDQRKSKKCVVCRYRFIANCVLEYTETDYETLNGIFVDGNSVYLKNATSGGSDQMTRPYAYQAQGIQKLKNYAMQSMANELENSVQSKVIASKESIPEAYQDAYTSPQSATAWIYNAFYNNNPAIPLNPPQPLVRAPIPPEFLQTFQVCDNAMQMVLGSFDAALGINDNQLSGVAIVEGATQSNSAAMPYIVSFLQALTQLFQGVLALIPKIHKTPMTLPVMDSQGKRSFVQVNTPQGINLQYDPSSMHVRVEAGVNFAVQKNKALQQIISLMQASPLFAQFINQEGLEILLDNLEIRGIDNLKQMATQFMQKMKMAQSQQQPNPALIKLQQNAQQMQFEQQQNQTENQLKAADIANQSYSNQTDRIKTMMAAEQAGDNNAVQMAKANVEHYAKSVDLALKLDDHVHRHDLESTDQSHRHTKDMIDTTTNLINAAQSAPNEETTNG